MCSCDYACLAEHRGFFLLEVRTLAASIAADRLADADRHVVADQSPAAPRQDGRTAGHARPLLLAPAGGESPDAAVVRVDAPADLGAPGPGGLAEWLVTTRSTRGVSCASHAANARRPSSTGPMSHLRDALTSKPARAMLFDVCNIEQTPQVRSCHGLSRLGQPAFSISAFENGNPGKEAVMTCRASDGAVGRVILKVWLLVVFAGLASPPAIAAEDIVLKWSEIAARTAAGATNPFNGARVVAITQLAVFEAVNAITGDYEPYLDPATTASAGASVDAAAIVAAHQALTTYFTGAMLALDAARDADLGGNPGEPGEDRRNGSGPRGGQRHDRASNERWLGHSAADMGSTARIGGRLPADHGLPRGVVLQLARTLRRSASAARSISCCLRRPR